MKGNTPQSAELKKMYDSGDLKKFSQITDKYTVSEQVKLGIKAAMPNIDFSN